MSEATQIVAIDGPAGAGKSSTAKAVARALGIAFLDTGAMYRAATWRALKHGVDLEDGEALAASTRAMRLEMAEGPEGQRVRVDGEDVSEAIRTPQVTNLIYRLDQNSEVRRHLVALQREFGERQPTVAEGRDIGTVVFPKAKCKIYMDAAIEERARRRAKQLAEKNIAVDFEQLCAEIAERDRQTMNRADSPLRRAEDAVLVDTTNRSFEEVVAEVSRLARERLGL
jgi:cytidylate kinase